MKTLPSSSFLLRPMGPPVRPLPPTTTCTPKTTARIVASASPAGGSSGGSVRREVLSRAERTKLNVQDDRAWYSFPRIVHHSDNGFRAQVTEIYRQKIPQGGAILGEKYTSMHTS